MNGPYSPCPLGERVHWVGAIDWALRTFHGYATPRGSTYNAFLVRGGEKTALIDTVKAPFKEEMLSRIAKVMPPGEIDYIVSNHAEMDHSGALPEMIELVKPEKVVASAAGVKALAQHFEGLQGITAVGDGDTLDLGGLTLHFTETKMLHWPESMVTWTPEERILFSQDIYGSHLATGERFDDEVDQAVLDQEAAKYYANIVMPYGKAATKAVEKIGGLDIDWKIVACDHGPMWRTRIKDIFERYHAWGDRKRTRKAIILYDTMWGSTETLARVLAEGLIAGGASVKVMPVDGTHRSDVATELLDAGALLVGAPTLNSQLYPSLADILSYIKGLRPGRLLGLAFGSHGWAGHSVKQIKEYLAAMNFELVEGDLDAQYVPGEALLQQASDLGKQVAARLKP